MLLAVVVEEGLVSCHFSVCGRFWSEPAEMDVAGWGKASYPRNISLHFVLLAGDWEDFCLTYTFCRSSLA